MADAAQALISSTLARYGLSGLADWAWAQILGGSPVEQVLLDMRQTPEYRDRFPAMEALAQKGRAFSEEAYVNYEEGLANLVKSYGLPDAVYGTRGYVSKLLTNDVSLNEAKDRMDLAQAASTTMPNEMRAELGRIYGVTPGQMTSYWLQPEATKPLLERQFAAATVAGEARIAGLDQLSQVTAERLTTAGITREQARQGFAGVSRELGVGLPGEAEAGLGAQELALGAAGVGTSAEALLRRRRQRLAAFASGGEASATAQGVTGLGTTRR